MNRREFISIAGLGALAPAAAGCTALLGTTACDPATDHLGDVESERPVEDTDRAYRFRGTVVGYLDEGVLVDDTTGKAHVVPGPSKQQINRDLVAVGDCVEGEGGLDRERTRTNGMPVLVVDRANFEALGNSTVEVEPFEGHPEPEFGNSRQGSDVTLTVTDGDDATAGNVFVAFGTESHPWPDLDDETGLEDPLRVGASVTVRDPPGEWVVVQWRSPDRSWGHRVAMARA